MVLKKKHKGFSFIAGGYFAIFALMCMTVALQWYKLQSDLDKAEDILIASSLGAVTKDKYTEVNTTLNELLSENDTTEGIIISQKDIECLAHATRIKPKNTEWTLINAYAGKYAYCRYDTDMHYYSSVYTNIGSSIPLNGYVTVTSVNDSIKTVNSTSLTDLQNTYPNYVELIELLWTALENNMADTEMPTGDSWSDLWDDSKYIVIQDFNDTSINQYAVNECYGWDKYFGPFTLDRAWDEAERIARENINQNIAVYPAPLLVIRILCEKLMYNNGEEYYAETMLWLYDNIDWTAHIDLVDNIEEYWTFTNGINGYLTYTMLPVLNSDQKIGVHLTVSAKCPVKFLGKTYYLPISVNVSNNIEYRGRDIEDLKNFVAEQASEKGIMP